MTDPTLLACRALDLADARLAALHPAVLDEPSGCARWRIADLLAHLVGAADALTTLVRTGVRELPDRPPPLTEPIRDARAAVVRLRTDLGLAQVTTAWTARAAGDSAVEFTVHAWDLDPTRPLPDDLASGVLRLVQPAVDDAVRQQFFAPEVAVAPDAPAGDRLVAFLGRTPR